MVESKECRERFDKITKGLENKGYMDWKKWVLEQVEDYTDEKLQNLVKRTEIKLRMADEERGLIAPDIMKEFIPFITILLTTLVTTVVAMVNTTTTIYNSRIDEAHVVEYAELIGNASSELFGQLLAACAVYAVVYMLLYALEKHLDRRTLSNKAKTRIYYRELLEILREKLES